MLRVLLLLALALTAHGADLTCPRELERPAPGMPTLDALRRCRRLHGEIVRGESKSHNVITFLGTTRTGKSTFASQLASLPDTVGSTNVLFGLPTDVDTVNATARDLRLDRGGRIKVLILEMATELDPGFAQALRDHLVGGPSELDLSGLVVFLNVTTRVPVTGNEGHGEIVANLLGYLDRGLAERLAPQTILFPPP